MTHRTPITSKFVAPFYLAIAICFFCLKASAQKEYTTILKNINPEAQNLYHDLSPQGDTLYLGAESIFYKVTFLNSLDRKVYTFNPPVLTAKMPLHDIIVGDYTVLVYKKDRIIVFHIKRILEIEAPTDMVPSELRPLEESLIAKTIPDNEIYLNGMMDAILHTDEMILAMKEATIDIEASHKHDGMKAYGLSSLNREGMQSRAEYRLNNLRPNGKPYYLEAE